jgi:hypothetical protein
MIRASASAPPPGGKRHDDVDGLRGKRLRESGARGTRERGERRGERAPHGATMVVRSVVMPSIEHSTTSPGLR